MDIVGMGTVAVDYVAIVPKISGPEEKVGALNMEIHLGGVAGNALTQLALLDANVGWFGRMGNDEAAKLLLDDFSKNGIDISHIIIEKDKRAMFTWIQVDPQGQRSIIMFPNSILDITLKDMKDEFRGYIKDAYMFSSEATIIPLSIVLEGAKIAKEENTKFVLDIDVDPLSLSVENLGTKEELEELISLSYATIPCKSAAKTLTGKEEPYEIVEELLKMGPQFVGITLGKDGCMIGNRKKIVTIPAYHVDVIDTTGAGDAFHGAFMYGLLNQWDIEDIGKFSNAAAALVCTKLGARSNFTQKDIYEFMKNYTE